LEEGAAKVTVALRFPVAVATTEVGAPGAVVDGVHNFVFPSSPASERFVLVKVVPQYVYVVIEVFKPKNAYCPSVLRLLGITNDGIEEA